MPYSYPSIRVIRGRTKENKPMRRHLYLLGALLLASSAGQAQTWIEKPLSHPVLRPLPEISKRPLAKGPGYFVDPARGKDDAAGDEKAPWRTIQHALKKL